jgi:hypothetical protein
MPFIGNKPAQVPLTSADIADGIITTAKIADGNITSTKILDGTILNADINASAAIASTKLSGSFGITEADQWRLNTALTITTTPQDVTANWERIDNTGFTYIGTGMTQSSGIFTFPSTGIYLIRAIGSHYMNSGASGDQYFRIAVTTNNSTYTAVTNAHASGYGTAAHSVNVSEFIFDVTSTTNCKVKFQTGGGGSTILRGTTDASETHVTFIRLGDT